MRFLLVFSVFMTCFIQSGFAFINRTSALPEYGPLHNKKNLINISYNYLDKNFDPFGVIEDELDSIGGNIAAPGEMTGYNLFLFGNLNEIISGKLNLAKDEYDFGWSSTSINHYLGQFNFSKKYSNIKFTLSLGTEYSDSDDIVFDEPDPINLMIKRINPGSGVKIIKDHDGYWFDLGDGALIRSGDSSKNIAPSVTTYDSKSISYYSGAAMHYCRNNIYAGIFVEYGRNYIDSKIDTNIDLFMGTLKNYLSVEQKEFLDNFPLDLNRDEPYYSGGFYLQIPLIYNINSSIAYTYIRLDRDEVLDYEPENHALKINFTYFLNDKFSVNLGGQYLYRQLNGVVPYLYNQYTQTTFDHKYGYISAGLSYYF